MEKVVVIFDGPEGFRRAADRDHDYYASLTSQQRLDITVSLQERYRAAFGPSGQRLARVARVLPLGSG